VEVRGNVDTRLRKLQEGQFDALILARAGLVRLGLEPSISEILPPQTFLPAPGQGALAVEVRADDSRAIELAGRIDDTNHHACIAAERRLLQELQAGCSIPLGAWARWSDSKLVMDAVMADEAGSKLLRASCSVQRSNEAEILGGRVAQDLISRGAKDLMAKHA
jgi:hydroxymethylbilane synthase